jgi:hypothetical protein
MEGIRNILIVNAEVGNITYPFLRRFFYDSDSAKVKILCNCLISAKTCVKGYPFYNMVETTQ